MDAGTHVQEQMSKRGVGGGLSVWPSPAQATDRGLGTHSRGDVPLLPLAVSAEAGVVLVESPSSRDLGHMGIPKPSILPAPVLQ